MTDSELSSRMIANMFQTVQRLADSWRNLIGSAGIAILLAFCDSQDDLRNSDEGRMEFAKYYLKDLRFLYTDTDHNDKKVRNPKTISYTSLTIPSNGRGSFVAPSSSRLLQLISLLSTVRRKFLASMTNPLLLPLGV